MRFLSMQARIGLAPSLMSLSGYVTVRGLNGKYSPATANTASHEKLKAADKDGTKIIKKKRMQLNGNFCGKLLWWTGEE